MPEKRYIRESMVLRGQPGAGGGKCCAYNRTRERFLCADVEAGDFPASALDARLSTLTPGSGTALWIVPSRVISPTSVRVPVDLVYLDRNCVVLHSVEAFPLATAPAGSATAASVLALPANTIASAGIDPGDQLILCSPEDMKLVLQQLLSEGAANQAEQSTNSSADLDTAGSSGRVLRMVGRSRPEPSPKPTSEPSVEMAPVELAPDRALTLAEIDPAPATVAAPEIEPAPEAAAVPATAAVPAPLTVEPERQKPKAAKSWLQRMLSPDPPEPRQSARESLEGLSAFFFTGGESVAHGVRDISPTGFYVFTEERWYPGTIMRMTLTDRREPTAERSITVNATVMRRGNDGVGLAFVFADGKNSRRGVASQLDGAPGCAGKAEVEQFIQRLRGGAS